MWLYPCSWLADRLDGGIVDFNGDAAMEEFNREYQQAPVAAASHEEPLETGQWPLGDPRALSLSQEGIGLRCKIGGSKLLDCGDLLVGDWRKPVPALSKNPDDPSCTHDLDVAALVDRMVHEEVTGEHGMRQEPPATASPRPFGGFWQKDPKSAAGQLIVHELLAVAVSPDCEPLRRVENQGFAPF